MTVLTISRQMASLGDEVAETLARRLGWDLITRKNLINLFFSHDTTTHEQHMLAESAKFYLNPYRDKGTYFDYLKQAVYQFTKTQSAVLVGFGSQLIFAGDRDAIHIRIIAPESVRLGRVRKQYQLNETNASKVITTADRKHRRFVSTIYQVDLTDPCLYDLILNTESLSIDECVSAILAALHEREASREMELAAKGTEIQINPTERGFKNLSEVEFAKILDMYQIEYKYEPKTFPIEWDAEGNVTLAFSPDFYLPQFDTYLELTTMNQRYVTAKNRKARKLRELYPGINIKIVYKKDFLSLIERFNLSRGD